MWNTQIYSKKVNGLSESLPVYVEDHLNYVRKACLQIQSRELLLCKEIERIIK